MLRWKGSRSFIKRYSKRELRLPCQCGRPSTACRSLRFPILMDLSSSSRSENSNRASVIRLLAIQRRKNKGPIGRPFISLSTYQWHLALALAFGLLVTSHESSVFRFKTAASSSKAPHPRKPSHKARAKVKAWRYGAVPGAEAVEAEPRLPVRPQSSPSHGQRQSSYPILRKRS